MLKLIIGNKAYSSWSLRGWLACKQAGLPFEEVVVSLYDGPWDTRRSESDLAPSAGKVPLLWDGDVAVWDSLAILDHLADVVGAELFWPADKAARGFARSIVAEMHAGFGALRREHGMNLRRTYPPVPPSTEAQADIDRVVALWTDARTRFGASGPYLFGEFGAADIFYAPVATRFRTWSIPASPVAQAYIDAILAHPWMREWDDAAAAESWVIDKFEGSPAV